MQTLGDFLYWAEEYFTANSLVFGHGTDNAWDEAVAIAMYVLKLPVNVTDKALIRNLTEMEKKDLISLAEKRVSECIPIPYLIKEAWFCSDQYYVDKRVIITRSPFAELINNKFQPYLEDRKIFNILDLCTGSGCIAIACAKAFANVMVDAVDLSKDALDVANYNIKLHNLTNRVTTIYSDLFQELVGKKYDLIISNPPYVSEKEHFCLPEEYQHEPKLALVSGKDGLICTENILKKADQFLKPKGLLFVEVGNSWHTLKKKYPNIPFNWLTFNNGGEGVFMLTREQLVNFKESI